jgi:hypothetical protein
VETIVHEARTSHAHGRQRAALRAHHAKGACATRATQTELGPLVATIVATFSPLAEERGSHVVTDISRVHHGVRRLWCRAADRPQSARQRAQVWSARADGAADRRARRQSRADRGGGRRAWHSARRSQTASGARTYDFVASGMQRTRAAASASRSSRADGAASWRWPTSRERQRRRAFVVELPTGVPAGAEPSAGAAARRERFARTAVGREQRVTRAAELDGARSARLARRPGSSARES